MRFFEDTFHLFERQLRSSVRMPVFLLLSIVQPLLWVLIFSQLFGAVASISGFSSGSYVQFLAPGIAVMTALFGAAFSGLGLLGDMRSGVLDRMLATPVHRGALIAGRLAFSAAQVVVQSCVILLAAAALGARPRGGVGGLLLTLAAAALLGAGIAGLSSAIALLTRRQELLLGAMNVLALPMTFLSSLMMDPALMPRWIRRVAAVNPVDWAVVTARGGFERGLTADVAPAAGLLLAFSLATTAFATRAFRRYRASL